MLNCCFRGNSDTKVTPISPILLPSPLPRTSMPSDLSEKVVLITGASTGIGAEIARDLSRRGYKRLAIVARRTELLEEVSQECRDLGAEDVLVLTYDLSDVSVCEPLVGAVSEHFGGRLDAVISNAGASSYMPARMADIDGLRKSMAINFEHHLFLAKYALPLLEETKGSIVFTTSATYQHPAPGFTSYAGAKIAMNYMAQCMAVEEGPKGIRVNVVSPGLIMTEMGSMIHPDYAMPVEERKEVARKNYAHIQPLGRVGEPSDMTAIFAFLISDENKFMTGGIIPCDGGIALTFPRQLDMPDNIEDLENALKEKL